MSIDRLKQIGLVVRETDYGVEADLDLSPAPLTNPLSHEAIERVTFTVVGERLIAIDPPELVGLQPLLATGVSRTDQLVDQVNNAFNDHIAHLQRRSSELQALS